MRADRFGSYSMAFTVAGIPSFSRRKSMSRSMRLCPPPRCRTVMRPYTLRPVLFRSGESRLFSGVDLVMSSLTTNVMYRRAGEVGLTDRMGMTLGSLHELDLVTGGQCHHGLLPPAPPAFKAAHALPLALAGSRSNGGHLDAEDLLHRLANLHLVGARRHLEGHHVEIFLLLHALLGHERAHQHRPGILHDLSASSRASNAACSKTTRPLRMT